VPGGTWRDGVQGGRLSSRPTRSEPQASEGGPPHELAAGEYGPTSRALLGLATAATPALAALDLAGWLPSLRAADTAPALLGLVLGALAADLVTGGVHWACDTWGDERTRWVGAGLIRSFREHHRDPRAMLEHDWIEVNGQPAAAASAAFGLLSLPAARDWVGDHAFVHAFLWSLFGVAALANQLHQWSHAPAPPRWVRRLQHSGVILSPARHARHHRPPHTGDYCITGGWLNTALDAAGFWRALERAVTRVTGAAPRGESTTRGASLDGEPLSSAANALPKRRQSRR